MKLSRKNTNKTRRRSIKRGGGDGDEAILHIEPMGIKNKKLLIVIPYRNREDQLYIITHYFSQYLKDIDYKVIVIEQNDRKKFNRGKINNVGYLIGKDNYDFDYVCFHDVDMLPLDADYSFVNTPTVIFKYISKNEYRSHYDTNMGGVVLFQNDHFEKINGFYNKFNGWGKEDDDLYRRVIKMFGSKGQRLGKYISLPPNESEDSIIRKKKWIDHRANHKIYLDIDGNIDKESLSDTSYTINDIKEEKLYTLYKVNI